MKTNEIMQYINQGHLDQKFLAIYDDVATARLRYTNCIEQFSANFGADREVKLFSAPGRTEVGGNHTDHQHGRVLAGAVSLDVIAAVSLNNDNVVRLLSQGHEICVVNLDNLFPVEAEMSLSNSLIRGISAKISELGYTIGGFDAYTTSNVLGGSGLSSSAAFEVLVAQIINVLYCNKALEAVQLAKISQYAENVYFGKPCGLMDQTACAVGGFITIDFADPSSPIVKPIKFTLNEHGYKLVIVNTGANHADLTDDYASIPADMKQVAKYFKKEFLRDVEPAQVFKNLAELRKSVNDRAILRAIHFFDDNDRVPKQSDALMNKDLATFFTLINESGQSSYDYLQNVFSTNDPLEQSVSLTLCLTKRYIGNVGACRVHGGGFAGTIQVFMRDDMVNDYIKLMETALFKGCCYVLNIRNEGSIELL